MKKIKSKKTYNPISLEGDNIIFHTIFLVFYIILCFTLFGILDRVLANKIKALISELQRNIDEDDEQLSNKEKVLLNKTVFWSRIRVGVGILMFIGLLLIVFI